MKPSTLAELAGFTALVYGAFQFGVTAGVFALGFCLLLIGYATEDHTAGLAVGRIVTPVKRRAALARIRHQNRVSRRRRGRQERRTRREPQPAEVVVRVEGH